MVEDSRRIIADGVFEKLQNSAFITKANNDDTSGRGMGIFIAPNLAVTASHVVDEVGDPTKILAVLPERKEELLLTCEVRDKGSDYALLSCPGTPLPSAACVFCLLQSIHVVNADVGDNRTSNQP